MRGCVGSFILIGLLVWVTPSAEARDFKVYGYPTLKQGETEGAYWLDYFVRSDEPYTFLNGERVGKGRLLRHSFELEYGMTDRWSIAGYLDLEEPHGENPKYVQMRAVVSRYRLFNPKERFFDSALYFEYHIPYQKYRAAESLETQIILEKEIKLKQEIKPILIRLNPIFDKKLSGPDVQKGIEFEYAVGIYYPLNSEIQPGLEFYGQLGPISNLASPNRQKHFIFPTVDLNMADRLDLNLGLGVGLTGRSDNLIFKAIFSYEFD